ncbi:Ribosome-binding ATPase YchF (fragment) [Candidatus Roizmanbacteria bacterium]
MVRGASKGEGLGNKFLSHIREVEAIVHVVRLFEDGNVVHVSDKINPEDDIKTIETELILADLETVNKQKEPKGSSAPKEAFAAYEVVKKIKTELDQGIPVRQQSLNEEELIALKPLNLLTIKPVIYVFNVSEEQLQNKDETKKKIDQILGLDDVSFIFLCAKMEAEIVAFNKQEQKEYLKQFELDESGLNRLIKKAYEALGLISFLTAGIIEARAWTIKKGWLAPQAAGTIHTDFEKKFIKADIIPYQKFIDAGGWVKAREQGLVQITGKDYIMKDGEVVEFKIGA